MLLTANELDRLVLVILPYRATWVLLYGETDIRRRGGRRLVEGMEVRRSPILRVDSAPGRPSSPIGAPTGWYSSW